MKGDQATLDGETSTPELTGDLMTGTRDRDWKSARCRDGSGSLTDVFFSDHVADIARAQAICATCPVIDACLDGAIARQEPWGVWGGQLFANGRVLAHKRKRGRPPKSPTPVVQLTS